MPEPDCFLRYRISADTRKFTSEKLRHIRIVRCSDAWFYNGFIHWASEPSKHLCRRYMRSTECPSSLFIRERNLQAAGVYVSVCVFDVFAVKRLRRVLRRRRAISRSLKVRRRLWRATSTDLLVHASRGLAALHRDPSRLETDSPYFQVAALRSR